MPVARNVGHDFKPCPMGSHIARCIGVIDLGTQDSPNFAASWKVMLNFEIPGERVEVDGEPAPMTISKEYTLSLNEKATLRAHLESWRGRAFSAAELKGFEVANVLTHPCMISVIHKTSGKGKTYANISTISGLPKGVECPPIWHKPVKYEITDGKNEVFNALPNWIQAKILAAEENQTGSGHAAPPADPGPTEPEEDPECPF